MRDYFCNPDLKWKLTSETVIGLHRLWKEEKQHQKKVRGFAGEVG